MTKIPLSRHPQFYGETIRGALYDVLKSGWFTKGNYVKMFEQAVKDYYDVEHAISFGSGTMAHYAAAYALKIDKEQPEVIVVPAFTYFTTPWAMDMAKMHPVYVDINPDTYHLDYEEDCLWYEYITFMDTYGSICDTKTHSPDLCIIDACHSFGVPRKHLRGKGEVFSFNGGKLFGPGEGGMVITNDDDFAEKVYVERNAFSRMPELSAALGLEFMDALDFILEERRMNVGYYMMNLHNSFIPQDIPIMTNNYMFAVKSNHTFEIMQTLKDEIDLRQYYYPPLGDSPTATPNAYEVGKNHMVLPNGVNMQKEVESVTEMLNHLMDKIESEEKVIE